MSNRKKIIMLPLDERPCNYLFPKFIMQDNPEYELIMPERDALGQKKQPANVEEIYSFLRANAKEAVAAVLSIDTLLYGGLLYGRLHHLEIEEISRRLHILREMKALNPKLKIYAFHLIMRCPQYSSADEEPDYYGECGREIFLYGEGIHKKEQGLLSAQEEQALEGYSKKIAPYLGDYLHRRKVNTEMNCKVIDLVGDLIDFLIIPQDDSSVYGYVARDQQMIREYVSSKGKQFDTLIYPGADEVGLTLLARAIAQDKGVMPNVSVFYSANAAPFIVPKYEDRMLGESVKAQIAAAGCIPALDVASADFMLGVNAPAGQMQEADEQPCRHCGYTVNRSLNLFVEQTKRLVDMGKQVAIADVAYGNGADLELVRLMEQRNLTFAVTGYAGWNTSGNTLGTTICMAVLRCFYPATPAFNGFLALRYFEDAGYCAFVRRKVMNSLFAKGVSINPLNEYKEETEAEIARELSAFMEEKLPSVGQKFVVKKCVQPWNRMFETELWLQEK